jgi:hypothetical protein
MKTIYREMSCLAVMLLVLAGAGGCRAGKENGKAGSTELTPATDLGPTIGSVATVVTPAPIAVEGYGLVGGLAGAGSAYCPPRVRAYLKRYIPTQLPTERVSVDGLLNSKNMAVVRLEGEIPALPSENDRFDVRVAVVPGSEAASIQGGWLYKAELFPRGTFGAGVRPLATVEGPVFINLIGAAPRDLTSGHILGGGQVGYDSTVLLKLRRADYRMASTIRNRLSERYGPHAAQALSPGDIEVRIPPEYRYRKPRFVAMIPATFLTATEELTRARVSAFVQRLAATGNKDDSEVALEAIGRESLGELSALLSAADAEVRLRAARCMLSLGDDRGFAALHALAMDKESPHRLEALEAIMVCARRNEATALARRLLRDEDVKIVLAAYEHLRRLEDPAVTRESVGRSFFLEQVVQTSHKAIFVARSGEPRIVLFGAPLACRDNVFVESPDKAIVIDSRAGQDYVSVFRKHPTRPGVLGPIRTGRDVREVIHALGDEIAQAESGELSGLGVSYPQVIALMEQLTVKEAVAAEFWAGPLPKIGPLVKK